LARIGGNAFARIKTMFAKKKSFVTYYWLKSGSIALFIRNWKIAVIEIPTRSAATAHQRLQRVRQYVEQLLLFLIFQQPGTTV